MFDERRHFIPEREVLVPKGDRRVSTNPHANGGMFLVDLNIPDCTEYAVKVKEPAIPYVGNTCVLGTRMRALFKSNAQQQNFRFLSPDETHSNRLGDVFEEEDRTRRETPVPSDDYLAPDGRVMEVLSEHLCEG